MRIVTTTRDILKNHGADSDLMLVIGHLTRFDLHLGLSAGPLSLSMPSSAMSKGTHPWSPGFYGPVEHYCTRRSLLLNYTDANASVNYDATNKRILISGLKAYHIRQITRLFNSLRINYAAITRCERTEAARNAVCHFLAPHRTNLVSVEIRDVKGRDVPV